MAIKEINFSSENFELSYELYNLDKKEELLIIHGWGANKELMKRAFKDKLPDFKQIYIDLSGFGKSSQPSFPLTSFSYAEILKLFLEKTKLQPKIILGHSFGGKVATLLKPEILVLLSSAGIIEEKSSKVKMKIAVFKALKNLGLSKFRKFFIAKDAENMNEIMYETFKNAIKEDFSSIFAQRKGKTLIFWGEEDKATSLQAGEKIHQLIENSLFFPMKGDHFFFLQNAKEISELIEKEAKC